MATIHIALLSVSARALTGATLPVPDSVTAGSDTKTTSATSALSALTGAVGQVWSVVSDGPVFLLFGTGTPTAVSGAGWRLPANVPREFAVTTASEKLAFKDAP